MAGAGRPVVAMLETERPVITVITWETPRMISAPPRPELPTTQPMRRYITTPRIVRMLGVNTPEKVPKRA